jgi:hypothetical protein
MASNTDPQQRDPRAGLIPLQAESRAAIPTAEAACHLGRSQQTLRVWACRENGPLRPLRINGRLAWPTAELRRLLGVA